MKKVIALILSLLLIMPAAFVSPKQIRHLASAVSKSCPPAKETDVGRILTVSLEASKTTSCDYNK